MSNWTDTEQDLPQESWLEEEFEDEEPFEVFEEEGWGTEEFDVEFEMGPRSGSAEHVRWVQSSLNRILGAGLTVDGVNGTRTRDAVRRFQSSRGLRPDGIVGPQTEAAIRQALRSSPTSRPTLVLDRFEFDRDRILPHHRPLIARTVAQILAQLRRPAGRPAVTLVGHTDPVGSASYNVGLGKRRAEAVRRALVEALERLRPGSSSRVVFRVESRGEAQPISRDAARNRRVELLLPPTGPPPRPHHRPPHRPPYRPPHRPPRPAEDNNCGVPVSSVHREAELEDEIYELETTARRRTVTVRRRLSLFQNHSTRSHRNHFQCGALRQARRIAAIASPDAHRCPRRVGATPYDTGADIIRAIEATHTCLDDGRLDMIHVFSHGFSRGIPGTTAGSAGLYQNSHPSVDRAAGGRTVSDVPAGLLSNNVTIVLHGCNVASGTDNFARSLFSHLSATLTSPKVFGHHNGGCAGRNNSWREYSTRHPTGRDLRSLPNIASTPCCGP